MTNTFDLTEHVSKRETAKAEAHVKNRDEIIESMMDALIKISLTNNIAECQKIARDQIKLSTTEIHAVNALDAFARQVYSDRHRFGCD